MWFCRQCILGEGTLLKKQAEVTHKIGVQRCGYLRCILVKRLISIRNSRLLKKRCRHLFTALSIVLSTGNACAPYTGHAPHFPQSMAA